MNCNDCSGEVPHGCTCGYFGGRRMSNPTEPPVEVPQAPTPMPALPEPQRRTHSVEMGRIYPPVDATWIGYTADQMHAYARAYAEQETARLNHLLDVYRTHNQRLEDDNEFQCDRAEKAEQETAALLADALRYRWLRDHDHADLYCSWIDELLNMPDADAAEFDAAIDAALASNPQETQEKK